MLFFDRKIEGASIMEVRISLLGGIEKRKKKITSAEMEKKNTVQGWKCKGKAWDRTDGLYSRNG